ncbi:MULTISPECIES: hypothetical protein [Halomonas]|jgi:hypothetical protein|uniref:Uncharacterized protein n=1 Tax=Halomonas sp. H10-59 TaxID=2950874 RepID=A0AAU7KU75_9GAMM|nr:MULTISPECIES: hypothetical protein [Halomonas]KJZ08763.1 hypothetical protein TW86_15820 [Halomonas sp. S2151]MBY5939479.1 hypothetical protein [Halomonas sp. DP5N14-9]MBY6110676.1 hypothetical protein [Halomonas sp. DP1Y21-3]MCO7217570.1 hypothetical protein [Halomonas sp. OfavH-34-E]|tara:strand:- start:1417 stop:1935 length:519 start_codon:yes stop_codon:yes gene_type:complete
MRQFFFPRAPLARRTLLSCHFIAQLGVLAAGLWWLIPRTPWVAMTTWSESWPPLALGAGLTLLTMVALRLLAELWLLPHHLGSQRPGFAPGAVVTRSYDRRPAVHDDDKAWTSQARPLEDDDAVVGDARVTRKAEPLSKRGHREPGLDLNRSSTGEPESQRVQKPSRQEPSL